MDSVLLEDLQRLWTQASNPDRLYPLRSYGWSYGFYTGVLPDGRQTIAFWHGPEHVVLLLFSAEGTYLGAERTQVKPLPTAEKESRHDDEPVHDHFGHEFGFAPARILVKRFHDPEWLISVEPLASCYRDFIQDPMGYTGGDADEFRDYLKDVRNWVEKGRFEFGFYNDFWMDADGDVECS